MRERYYKRVCDREPTSAASCACEYCKGFADGREWEARPKCPGTEPNCETFQAGWVENTRGYGPAKVYRDRCNPCAKALGEEYKACGWSAE